MNLPPKSKKIIIFSTAYYPAVGGAEVAINEITARLPEFEFDLIAARMDQKEPSRRRVGRTTVYKVGIGKPIDKFLLPLLGTLKAIRLNKQNSYQLIWALMASQGGITASFFKMLHRRIPLLLNVQEGDNEDYLKRYVGNIEWLYKILIRPWHRLVFKKADFITAISHDLKKRALKNGARCPIKIIPNGVNIKQFLPPKNLDKKQLRQSLGLSPDNIIIITTSRLALKNGIEDLIKGFAQFCQKHPHSCLLILGKGELEAKLKNLTKDLNLQNKVKFLGFVPHSQLPQYLWAADVFCRPSLSEGFGNSFLEAMAAGIPVVATPVGGIVDFVFDSRFNKSHPPTGFFCQPQNCVSINQALEIAVSPNYKKTIIQNAQKMVKEKYSWDKIAQDTKQVLNNLIGF